jgi:hypothetical protein
MRPGLGLQPVDRCGHLGRDVRFNAIPEQYTSGLGAIANEKFVHTPYTFDGIVKSTLDRAVEIIKRTGGASDGDVLTIKLQEPKPITVPTYTIGKPAERVSCDDARWKWTGDWKREVSAKVGAERAASSKGDEVTIEFSGTGAILCGPYVPDGGTADVFIDGKLDRTIDVLDDDGRRKVLESVWHRFDLPPGPHTLKLVVRGEPFGKSKGSAVRVHSLIVYR